MISRMNVINRNIGTRLAEVAAGRWEIFRKYTQEINVQWKLTRWMMSFRTYIVIPLRDTVESILSTKYVDQFYC